LPARENAAADKLMLDLFARRAELVKAKGDGYSGADVFEAVVTRMAHHGPKALKVALARAHTELDADALAHAVQAALSALPPAEVFDLFSPYLLVPTGDKKKGKDAVEKKNAVIEMLGGDSIYGYRHRNEDLTPLDPRWLDLAVKIGHLGLMNAVGRPGHPAAEAFLQAEFDETFKKAKSQDQLREVVTVMVMHKHPKAADALLASYEKTIGKANAGTYWYYPLVGELPQSAVPRLEAVIPKLKDREADRWVEVVQALRDKK
jgi:hypothetical protein